MRGEPVYDATTLASKLQKPGLDVGNKSGTNGLYLNGGSITCFRVDSLEICAAKCSLKSDGVELGAARQTGSDWSGCKIPHDGYWYRFYDYVIGGTFYCGLTTIKETSQVSYEAAIFATTSHSTTFTLDWNFSAWKTVYSKFLQIGWPIEDWERGDGNDPGYAEWDGLQYMDISGNWHDLTPPCEVRHDDAYWYFHAVSNTDLKIANSGSEVGSCS